MIKLPLNIKHKISEKTLRIIQKTKGKRIGIFIDNANWFYPQRELGWHISYTKLRRFLEQFYSVSVIKLYIGTPLNDKDILPFNNFCKVIKKSSIVIKTKPLKKIWINQIKRKFEYKCNFDVEIALDVARHINTFDIVMIGSGDSDFLEVRNYAFENNKGFIALCFEKGIAWEMRKQYHIFLEDVRKYIQKT